MSFPSSANDPIPLGNSIWHYLMGMYYISNSAESHDRQEGINKVEL